MIRNARRHVSSLRAIVLAAAALTGAAARAEAPAPRHGLVDGRLYLGGQGMEIGLAQNGAIGPRGPRPASFVGTPFDSGVGMSVDLDGYGVGANLPIDYFLAGNPEERWSAGFYRGGVKVTASAAARNTGTGDLALVGLYDESYGDHLQGRSVGVVRQAGVGRLEVTQTVSFEDDDMAMTVKVRVKNVGADSIDNVRYMRAIDPDNTAFRGGLFTTENSILKSHRNGDGMEVVRAQTYAANDPILVAHGSRAPMLIMTADARGRVSRLGLNSSDPFLALAWSSPPPKGQVRQGDERLSVTFAFGTLAAGASAEATYVISLDGRATDTVLALRGDADADGLTGLTEEHLGLDPVRADTDADGTADGAEDSDADALDNAVEARIGTDAAHADSDRDGVVDADEDSDGDGLGNAYELSLGSDPAAR